MCVRKTIAVWWLDYPLMVRRNLASVEQTVLVWSLGDPQGRKRARCLGGHLKVCRNLTSVQQAIRVWSLVGPLKVQCARNLDQNSEPRWPSQGPHKIHDCSCRPSCRPQLGWAQTYRCLRFLVREPQLCPCLIWLSRFRQLRDRDHSFHHFSRSLSQVRPVKAWTARLGAASDEPDSPLPPSGEPLIRGCAAVSGHIFSVRPLPAPPRGTAVLPLL